MESLSFKTICQRLESLNLPKFDLIVGIAEGGIVPASLAAYKAGCDIEIIKINYRDINNSPSFDKPKLLSKISEFHQKKNILIVDDVSVSGKTLDFAKSFFRGNEIKTLVFKGKGDFVLFPEIKECVNWPWKMEF
ncbi:MAG TPA: phosphoribosyltransferase [Ignavibacteriaceae bacterium]|jgi:hypoxanthine phosphoribosyltransferase|nr:phosphoribosyltransferase [Ignavibacteriaceae bacterium]